MSDVDPRGGARDGGNIFVVHKHAAPSAHFDFRLAIGGVLKNWAVPNGPSLDPRVKRLAVATDDLALGPANLEGSGTAGPRGTAAVEVWDHGTFDILTERDGRRLTPEEAFNEGRLLLNLHGQRLIGGWSLQRTGRGKKSNWLLIRMKEDGGLLRRPKAKVRQTTG